MKTVARITRNLSMAPPKNRSKKSSSKNEESTNQQTANSSPFSIDKRGDIQLKILAKPGSKTSEITGISAEGVDVKIAAPPVDGEANTELIAFLSKLFGVRKSDLSLDKGNRSRSEQINVENSTN